MSRDTHSWRPTISTKAQRSSDFPYQKALSSDVSRKGTSKTVEQPTTATAPLSTVRTASEQKYGASGMSGEQVDEIVRGYLTTRKRP